MVAASMPQQSMATQQATTGVTAVPGLTGVTTVPGLTGTPAQVQGLATTQLGMMLLLANQQNGGLGAGRISGVRNDPRQLASAKSQQGAGGQPRPSSRPGGLAYRYFNRTDGRTGRYPKNYFNRRPGVFP
jgi:hypothetical protein